MKTEPRNTYDSTDIAQAPLTVSNAVASAEHPSAWGVLRNRNYVLLFWGQLISSAGTQMQVVAVAWQVYILTHSAIALGLVGLVQAIPRLIFSLVGGVFADVFDRRKMLLIVEVVMASTSTVLALCTIYHVINMFIIYAVVLVSASISAFEFPTRQAIIPSLVPRERMKDALSLNMAMMQLTFIIGPMLGGFVIGWLGVADTYWIDVLSYFVVVGSLLLMAIPRVPVEKRPQMGMGALLDGMRFLRAHPVILAVLSLEPVRDSNSKTGQGLEKAVH
ncbi:MAG TPA: MFS transporter [Ktedonobacteraceae bacterium]|nr:MFS transporter [Ktedonobacteraceae bacterium]